MPQTQTRTGLFRSSERWELTLLGVFTLTYLTTNTDSQMLPPLLPSILSDFSGQDRLIGVLIPAFGIVAAMTSVLIGGAIDRGGVRKTLTFGCVMFMMGGTLANLTPTLSGLALARMMTGVGSASLSLSMMMGINQVFGVARQSQAFGYFVSGAMGAVVVGLPLTAWIESRWGWRGPFFVVIPVMAAVAGALSSIRALNSPRRDGGRSGSVFAGVRADLRAYRTILSNARLRLILSLGLLFNIGGYAMLALMGLWCSDRFGLTTPQVFRYYIFAGLAGIAVGPVVGRVSARVGPVPCMLFGTLVLMVLFPLVPFSPRPAVLMPLFILAGAITIFRLVPYHVLTLESADAAFMARFVGLRNAISQFGIFAGATCGWVIYSYLGLGYAAVGFFAAATCVATLPVLRLIGRT